MRAHCFPRLLLLLAVPVSAAQGQKRDTTRLEELVVTATRSPTPLRAVGSSADVLRPAELRRRQITTLREALPLVPGATVLVSGGPGGVASLFVRGVASTQTLFLVDGIRSNDANAGFASTLGGMDLAGTGRIEVIRGPQSTLYGGAAMGGVVSLETVRGAGRPSGSADFEAGSFRTWRGRAEIQGADRAGRLGYSASAGLNGTDNERHPNDWDQRSQTARADYRLARWLDVRATFRGLQNGYVSPGDLRTSNTTPVDSTRYHDNLGTLSLTATPVERWTSRLVAGLEEQFLRNWSRFDGSDEFVFEQKNRRRVLDWQNTLRTADRLTLIAGINREWSTVTTDGGAMDERLWGGYAEAQVNPAGALHLTAGLRADDYNTFENAVTWRVTGAWDVGRTGTTLRASLGTGFMPPSLAARFGSAFQNPNPAIRPERSRGWDAGVEQHFAGGRGRLGVTYFRASLRDLIGFESAPFPELGRNVNIDRARTSGIEVSARLATGPLEAQASYTYLSAKSLSESDPALTRLIRRPRHSLSADLLVAATPRLVAGGGVVALVDREDTDFNSFPSARVDPGDYVVARLHASYDLGAHLVLRARVENLFDKRYEPVYGFPALGRTLSGSLGLRF